MFVAYYDHLQLFNLEIDMAIEVYDCFVIFYFKILSFISKQLNNPASIITDILPHYNGIVQCLYLYMCVSHIKVHLALKVKNTF